MSLPEDRNQQPLNDNEREKGAYLIEKYEAVLISVAMRILRNLHDAEEAVQSAFASVLCHLDKIADCDSKKAANYLITATKNNCYKKIKDQNQLRRLLDQMEDERDQVQGGEFCDPVWDEMRERMTRQWLAEGLKKLDETNRMLLIGRYYLKMSYKELAEHFQISEDSVSTRLVRAKRKLAEILAEQDEVKK